MPIYSHPFIVQAARSFRKFYKRDIEWGIIAGSGLFQLFEDYVPIVRIPFVRIRNMHPPSVAGHRGEFTVLNIRGHIVVVQTGRLHLYEGYTALEVATAVGMMGELGIKKLILTNAAGGISSRVHISDLMPIADHINLQATSPLIGMPGSDKFIDLNRLYDQDTVRWLEQKFGLRSGIYGAVLGPNYETPAEINYLRTIGVDAVGMSTVQEALMARYYGMRIVGISLITNLCTERDEASLTHQEVIEIGKRAVPRLRQIIEEIVERG